MVQTEAVLQLNLSSVQVSTEAVQVSTEAEAVQVSTEAESDQESTENEQVCLGRAARRPTDADAKKTKSMRVLCGVPAQSSGKKRKSSGMKRKSSGKKTIV